ncbi:MAG: 1-deoxy-D-xylulose-5-phosphate reductoisomerase [Bacteroidales bacterium]|nr:1-deoxy-D-xylulose-5-phosphate reductoisomerase [Bacteroidales bacterium]
MNNNEETKPRRIAVLGSTGSMGTQALEVIALHPELLQLEIIAANSSADILIQQAKQYHPNIVVVVQEEAYRKVKEALADEDVKVFCGEESLCDVCEMDCVDIVLSCIVGIAGLKPAFRTVSCGTPLAIANKETLVVAGELIMRTAKEHNAPVIPVDSEHSAIFQCLAGEHFNPVEKLIITASGGAFRTFTPEQLEKVTLKDALKHPNWSMGPKVTIDSASLMNKGLEVIEAKWLFGMPLEKIDVLVHPQSVIHSMVQFEDGSVKAQLGIPDMRLPIQYALTFPLRLPLPYPRLDFTQYGQFTFEKPNREMFPCLDMAYKASAAGGGMPCVMNAANEAAVKMFMEEKIKFTDIPRIIEHALATAPSVKPQTIEEYIALDAETKQRVMR